MQEPDAILIQQLASLARELKTMLNLVTVPRNSKDRKLLERAAVLVREIERKANRALRDGGARRGYTKEEIFGWALRIAEYIDAIRRLSGNNW